MTIFRSSHTFGLVCSALDLIVRLKMKDESQAFSVEGTWLISGMPFGEDGFLIIREDGRTIQFPTSITKPRLNQTLRLWHSGFDGASIRFRSNPLRSGWLRGVERMGDDWSLVAECEGETKRFLCVKASEKCLPDWLPEMLDKNLARMDEVEAN